jgi:hypothetical protein
MEDTGIMQISKDVMLGGTKLWVPSSDLAPGGSINYFVQREVNI